MGERLRNLTWEDYEIDNNRYNELKYFCMQYKSKKKRASTVASHTVSPDSRHAQRRERDEKDCRMIENAAKRAAEQAGYFEAWEGILRSATENLSYERTQILCKAVPFAKTDFYAVRRAFFHYLDEMKNESGDKSNLL